MRTYRRTLCGLGAVACGLLLLALCGCIGCVVQAEPGDSQTLQVGSVLFQDATIVGSGPYSGQTVDVLIESGTITAIGDLNAKADTVVDLSGRWLAPAFIDSHVHLSFLPRREQMLDGGIAAAVDLAAPIHSLDDDVAPMVLLQSGPMVTAVQGYPTQSWGSLGYGIECQNESEVQKAVATLSAGGASVIKMPITEARSLSEAALRAGVEAAHSRGLKVASHAMSQEQVVLAAAVGIDVLAHTPTGQLSDAGTQAWSKGAVISTLRAFGGSDTAVDNLRRLRAAGATVLYGTDFGNLQTTGIVAAELDLLARAGLSGAEILASGTSVPAQWWGIEGLGSVDEGKRASFLILGSNPIESPDLLASPESVWIDGVRR
jgi:imidazolonepropionase-like amidohydrolase